MIAGPTDVLDFWFKESDPRSWFANDAAFDLRIRERFEGTWRAAREGMLEAWKASAHGALAIIITLDQFPRNMFRTSPEAFSTDALARAAADRAIRHRFDLDMPPVARPLFYLPLMHSECSGDQDRSVKLIAERVGRDSDNHRYAVGHRDVIATFGRFPSRNGILARPSTVEETEFLRSQPAP